MATVDSTGQNNSGTTTLSMTMPTPISANDLIIVFLCINATATSTGVTPATPSGYTSIGTQACSASQGYAWYKIAAGTEAGTTMSFTTSAGAGTKQILQVMVLSGTGVTWSLANSTTAADNTSSASRTAPSLSFSGANVSTVHLIWDKSAAPGTSWTVPTGFTGEVATYQTGAGALTAITALSNTNTVSSPQATATYTQTAVGSQGGMFTIAFNAAPTGGGGGGGTTPSSSDTGHVVSMQSVSVVGGGAAIAYVDSNSSNVNASSGTVTIPSTTGAGQVALAFLDVNTTNTAAPTVPSGWTQIGFVTSTSMMSVAYWRVLSSSDPGSVFAVSWGSTTRICTSVTVFSGVMTSAPIDAFAHAVITSGSASTAHPTPTITVGSTGAVAVEHATDKAATGNTSWTVPSGYTDHSAAALSPTTVTSPNVSCDTGNSTSTFSAGGTAGGNTWTSGQSAQGITWTITLKPGTTGSSGSATEFFAKAGAWVALPSFTLS